MELQSFYKTKNNENKFSIFRTLGDEKKVDYHLISKSLYKIRNAVNIFEAFLSPRGKLPKKIARRRHRQNTLLKNKRTLRNNSSDNSSIFKLNSSLSIDKAFRNRFSLMNIEEKPKDIKPEKVIKKGRNPTLNQEKEKNNIFITGFRNNTTYNQNIQINPNNIRQNAKTQRANKNLSLNKILPAIKAKTTIATNKKNLKNIDYVNKILNEDDKNHNTFLKNENPMIKRKNKFLSIDEKIVSNMIKKNNRIVNRINNIKIKFDNKMVNFEAKFKYLNWKYGTSDTNKYFIDIDSYKKDPEDLINNKKSFYDKLDDMVDRINEEKEKKDMESIKKQFGININKKKDNLDYNTIYVDEFDKLYLKGRKIKNLLKELFIRKKIEKENRKTIKNILDRSKDRINIINKNFNSFQLKEIKEMEFIEKMLKEKEKIKEKKDKNKNKGKNDDKKEEKNKDKTQNKNKDKDNEKNIENKKGKNILKDKK